MDGLDDDFTLFHTYNRLVAEGKAKPIVCPFCDWVFIVGHKDGELRLNCYACDTSVIPGLDLKSNVMAVVKEHFL